MAGTFTYRLQPFDGNSPYFAGAVAIYASTWGHSWERAYSFFASFVRYYPGYCGLVALCAEQVIGFGFGTRSLPGQWWHDQVAAQVGYGHPALQDAWVLTELALASNYRNQGVGGHLHDELLRRQRHPRVLLSTQLHNVGAQRFYQARGWVYLHPGFPFERGAPEYVIMSRECAILPPTP